ncbi:hypothetical protein EJ110_NYTH13668 [Nymphaea thermarum]|nr:hypothetical protein EJ110_NYTH13668 [Nymphaea thermarum]
MDQLPQLHGARGISSLLKGVVGAHSKGSDANGDVNIEVNRYTVKYAPNVTYATVKGGGHTAPEYRPKECYHMYERWLTGKSL